MPRQISKVRSGLPQELQPSQIVFIPTGLLLDYAAERLRNEGGIGTLKSHGNPAAIRMLIAAMTARAGFSPFEAVRNESANDLAGGQRADLR